MHSIEVHEKYTKAFFKDGNNYRLECTHNGGTEWRPTIPEFTLFGPGIEGLDDKYHYHTKYLMDGPFVRIYPKSMEIIQEGGRVLTLDDPIITPEKVKLLATARWNQEMLVKRVSKTGVLQEFIDDCHRLGDLRRISDLWFYGDRDRTYRQADLIKWFDWFTAALADNNNLPDLPGWAHKYFSATILQQDERVIVATQQL